MGYSQEEWTPLLIHEKMAGHRDALSHALCKLNQIKPPIICLAWKISSSLSCYVDNESMPLKIYLSLFQNRALAPLQIPASLCEGPIYLLLC